MHHPTHHDLLRVPQQLLMGEIIDKEREFRLGRACLLQCVSVARLMLDESADVSLDGLVGFLDTFGPGHEEKGYYAEGLGWVATSLADTLRFAGHPVVSQNLQYDINSTDLQQSTNSRRVTTDNERNILLQLGEFGGKDKNRWIEALKYTTRQHGLSAVSIFIPSIVDGRAGLNTHSVLVFDIDDETDRVEYIDTDTHAMFRYEGDAAVQQDIQTARDPGTPLYYSQPAKQFAERMTGQALHIFPKV